MKLLSGEPAGKIKIKPEKCSIMLLEPQPMGQTDDVSVQQPVADAVSTSTAAEVVGGSGNGDDDATMQAFRQRMAARYRQQQRSTPAASAATAGGGDEDSASLCFLSCESSSPLQLHVHATASYTRSDSGCRAWQLLCPHACCC